MANEANLRPVKTKKEARERGAVGGVKSGEAKREKKLLSEIYAKVLERKYGAQIGSDIIEDVIMNIIKAKGSPAVSMLKELREALEGTKVQHSGQVTLIDDVPKA